MQKLIEIVSKIKAELETELVKKSYIGFYDFPSGACMDASILLGMILYRHGFGAFQLVSAWNETGGRFSHAWLENDDILIDITAEQFVTWPVQSLIIAMQKLPDHYHSFEIQFKESVLQHNNVPDFGFYSTMRIVENAVNL